jgi:Golgi phosphoprotein 3 (GPP34)
MSCSSSTTSGGYAERANRSGRPRRYRQPVLIAEDLLLLLTDDRSGKLAVSATHADVALGGAMLLELALANRVAVAGESDEMRKGRLIVEDTSATSDSLLDEALARLGEKEGKNPKDVVRVLGKGLRDRLQARLVERGLLREESGKILGVIPTHRWPANDAAHENAVRGLMVDALRVGHSDDVRVAALVSLLHALKAVEDVVDPLAVGVTKNELNAHARSIAEGNWGSEAVRKAIDEMMAAVVAATTAAVVAAGSS